MLRLPCTQSRHKLRAGDFYTGRILCPELPLSMNTSSKLMPAVSSVLLRGLHRATVCAAASLVVMACLGRTSAAATPVSVKLAVLGSSTAAGTGASEPARSWTGLLQGWLRSRQAGTLENLAMPGALTGSATCGDPQGLPNWRQGLHPTRHAGAALAAGATHLILAFPSNDATTGVPVAHTLAHLRGIIDCARQSGAKVAMLSTQPRAGLSREQRRAIAEVDAAMRQQLGGCFVEVNAALADATGVQPAPALSAGDGVHYNDRGHAVVFGIVRHFMESGACF